MGLNCCILSPLTAASCVEFTKYFTTFFFYRKRPKILRNLLTSIVRNCRRFKHTRIISKLKRKKKSGLNERTNPNHIDDSRLLCSYCTRFNINPVTLLFFCHIILIILNGFFLTCCLFLFLCYPSS